MHPVLFSGTILLDPLLEYHYASGIYFMHQLEYNLAEVKRNIRKMEKMFKELKKRVIRLLQQMSISADDVVYELTELPASDVPEHESLFKGHFERPNITECRGIQTEVCKTPQAVQLCSDAEH